MDTLEAISQPDCVADSVKLVHDVAVESVRLVHDRLAEHDKLLLEVDRKATQALEESKAANQTIHMVLNEVSALREDVRSSKNDRVRECEIRHGKTALRAKSEDKLLSMYTQLRVILGVMIAVTFLSLVLAFVELLVIVR